MPLTIFSFASFLVFSWGSHVQLVGVELGTDKNISCPEKRRSRGDYLWTRQGGEPPEWPKLGRDLVIVNAKLADSGLYNCFMKPSDVLHSLNVTVGKKPMIKRYQESRDTYANAQRESLRHYEDCTVTGVPLPAIQWYYQFDGVWEKVQLDRTRFTTEERTINTTVFHSTLVIKDTRQDDSGWYRCVATNRFGNDSISVYLSVVPIDAHNLTIDSPEKVRWKYNSVNRSFSCSSSSLWQVHWLPTQTLPGATAINSAYYKKTLLFARVTSTTAGKYTCRATPVSGGRTEEKAVVVEVIGLPGPPPVVASTQRKWNISLTPNGTNLELIFSYFKGIRLDCSFTNYGRLDVGARWYFNNEEISVASSNNEVYALLRKEGTLYQTPRKNGSDLFLLEKRLESFTNTTEWFSCIASAVYYTEKAVLGTVAVTYSIPSNSNTRISLTIWLVVGLAVFVVMVAVIFLCLQQSRKKSSTSGSFWSQMVSSRENDYLSEQRRMSETEATTTENQAYVSTENWTSFDGENHWELKREHLLLQEEIGQGYFGVVSVALVKGVSETAVWTTVAVKRAKSENDRKAHNDLVTEANLMKLVGCHENVIKLLGLCTRSGPFLIVMEYAKLGNLRDYLRGKHLNHIPTLHSACSLDDAPLSKRQTLCYALQVAKGMEYLISRECIHRDLAARNVLVCPGEVLKISDFGLAKDMHYMEYYKTQSTSLFPVKWSAPEVIFYKTYTQFSDVWSYGIVLWEISTLGGTPYATIDMNCLYELLTESNYRMGKPKHCPSELYDFMQRCWYQCPSARPTFSHIVNELSGMIEADQTAVQIVSEGSDSPEQAGAHFEDSWESVFLPNSAENV